MKQGKGMDWHVSAEGWDRVHTARCLGKTCKVWQALCVADGSSMIYSWHNAGLRWMYKIAAKYKIK